MHAHDFAQTTAAGDERSTRDPKVLAKARKQHIANAAEWLRRINHFENQSEGTDYDALVASHRLECKYANIEPSI
jgi:hypothetical protein